jgi:hypothetical protein
MRSFYRCGRFRGRLILASDDAISPYWTREGESRAQTQTFAQALAGTVLYSRNGSKVKTMENDGISVR